MNCMPNRLMNPVPMSGNIISRFRWVLVAVAAALLVVPLALHAQSGLAAPGNLTATIGDTTVTLNWTDPGNTAITKYQISMDGGSNFINVECGNSTATGHTVMGLTNGTSYTFQVRAYDESGPGASATVTATPLFAAPTTLEAFPGDEFLHLRWDESTDSRISGYEVSINGGTTYRLVQDQGHEEATFGYSVLDLDNGTNYAIAVRAVNGKAATLNATPLLDAPSRLKATPGYGWVTLSWRNRDHNRIAKYQFSSDGGASYTSVASGSNDLISYRENDLDFIKYTITGLTNRTSYTFVVRTANNEDTVIGKEASVTATPFPAPSNLTAAPADGQVTLGWDDPETTEISKYQLKIDSGAFTDIPGSGATTTEHTVTGLTNYTSYTFELRAYDSNAAGPSAAVTAYPVAGPTAAPDNLQATPADSQVTLNWDDPGDSSITGYQLSFDGGAFADISVSTNNNIMQYIKTGLTNRTRYSFAVRAVNSSGAGAPSNTVSEEPGVAPVAVVNLTATPKHERVELSWDDPDPDDDDNRTSLYKVRYKKTNDNAWEEWVDNKAKKEVTIDELENATSYDFAVRAYNYIGDGAISERTASPVATVPLAPTNLVAARGDGEVTLTWTDTRNDEIITNYHISSDGGTNYTDIYTNVSDSGTATVSYIVRGLTNGTDYTFKVKAQNSAGTGPPPDPGVTETPLFAAPRGLQASPGGGQVTLSWDDPVYSVYNTNTITGYELSTDGGTSYSSITVSGAGTTIEHTVTGLTGGTSYSFGVRAVGTSLTGAPAMVTATPLFAAPTGLTATAGDGQVTLNWDDPDNSNTTGYELSIDAGAFAEIGGSDAATTSHTVTGLTNGTTYTFAVRAVNASGEGASSDTVTATPLFAAPTNLSAKTGDGQVKLSWTDPGNTNISGYEVSTDRATNYSAISDGDSEPTTISHTVTSLTNGTTYTFAVRAVNGAPATVTATPVGQDPPPTPPPVPGRPGNLTAASDDRAIALSWIAAASNGSPIIKYQHRRSGVEWEDVPDGPTATEVTVSGLTNGVEYVFHVRAVSSAGTGAQASVSATPAAAPDAPGNLTATPDDGAVALSWTAAEDNGSPIIKYQHQRDDAPWADIAGEATANSLTVTGLVNDTRYTFSVRAVNGMGEGAVASVTAAPQADLADPEPGETPVPTPTATPEPTRQVVVPTSAPTRQVVLPTSTLEPQKAEALATVTPLTAIGPVVVTPTAARMVGPTPLPTATPTPGLTATVVPRGTLEPTVRPIATPAETPLEEALGRITDSSLVPVGIGLFTVLIVALAALLLASRRRR